MFCFVLNYVVGLCFVDIQRISLISNCITNKWVAQKYNQSTKGPISVNMLLFMNTSVVQMYVAIFIHVYKNCVFIKTPACGFN